MNVIFGIDNRFKPLTPFQGCVGYFANVPRALPWAILFRPFRAIKTIRSAFMQQFRRNAPGYIFSPACIRQAFKAIIKLCSLAPSGLFGCFTNVPRTLPWAILFRPFRAIKTIRPAFMQQFRRNAPGYIRLLLPAAVRLSGVWWIIWKNINLLIKLYKAPFSERESENSPGHRPGNRIMQCIILKPWRGVRSFK